jgi:hypothetical protein
MNYVELARQKAIKYGLNPDIFVRQIDAESSFNPSAVSSAGAVGLGQLMPNTARELGVDPTDPEQNLEGAAMYMRQQLDRFGTYPLALSAYNAGPSRVTAANGVPNITETKNYVSKILGSGDSAMQTNASSAGLLTGANLTKAAMELEDKYKQGQMEKPLFQRDTFKDTAGDLAVLFNSMRLDPDENIVKMVDKIKDQRTEKQSRNLTLDLMAKAGRDDLVAAVQANAFTPKEAFATMFNEAAELRKLQAKGGATADIQEYNLAVTQGYKGTFADWQMSGKKRTEVGTIPQGYELVEGRNEKGEVVLRMQPIKGGPADTAKSDVAKKEAQSASGMVVLEDIGRALEIATESPFLSTGFVGGILRKVGGTPAKDLASLTTTIQANIGFDRLQRMREESPTGGALGQVAVQELEALQATLGNLDNSQTNEQVVQNLTRLEEQYRKSMQEIYKAALKDQEEGKINTKTGRVITPMDYFSSEDIQMLSGAAPKSTDQPASSANVTHRYNPVTKRVEAVK